MLHLLVFTDQFLPLRLRTWLIFLIEKNKGLVHILVIDFFPWCSIDCSDVDYYLFVILWMCLMVFFLSGFRWPLYVEYAILYTFFGCLPYFLVAFVRINVSSSTNAQFPLFNVYTNEQGSVYKWLKYGITTDDSSKIYGLNFWSIFLWFVDIL